MTTVGTALGLQQAPRHTGQHVGCITIFNPVLCPVLAALFLGCCSAAPLGIVLACCSAALPCLAPYPRRTNGPASVAVANANALQLPLPPKPGWPVSPVLWVLRHAVGHLRQPWDPRDRARQEPPVGARCPVTPVDGMISGYDYDYDYIYIYIYIYISSNLHPSPNSRWLHHTAPRYVRRAQSGTYMWWKGLTSVKTGSKWAKNTCLSIPNGPGSLLEKRAFDPFLTHFWSQNGPFSRHFGIFHEPNSVATGSKWAKTTDLRIPNGPGSFLEKRVFDPFLTHFWSHNGPFPRHFGIFHGPKRATTGSKRPKNTCLRIPSGLGTTLKKIIFFALGTLVDPPLAPTVRGLAGPRAAPSDHWYGGLRVSLGDCEGWKP